MEAMTFEGLVLEVIGHRGVVGDRRLVASRAAMRHGIGERRVRTERGADHCDDPQEDGPVPSLRLLSEFT